MRIPSAVARAARLSTRDVAVLFGVAALELSVALALLVAPLSMVRRSIRILQPLARRLSAAERRVLWALDVTGRRLPFASNCLVRALAAELLLTDRARPMRVVVGVRRTGGRLEGHAWVERDGRVIVGGAGERSGGADAAGYTPMFGWDA